jgi:hypothetical protein
VVEKKRFPQQENPMKKRAIFVLATTAFGMTLSVVVSAQQATPNTAAPNPAATAQSPTPTTNPNQTQGAKPTAPPADPTAPTTPIVAPPPQSKEDKGVNANKQAQQAQLPQSDASAGVASLDTSGLTSAELQQKIEAALHNEPTLSGSVLTVNVTDDEINVNGTVGTGKERTTASRIVQSFGENRKVKEKINVSGVKK